MGQFNYNNQIEQLFSSCSVLCTVTLMGVDWEAEAKLAQAQQRTIDSLEEAMASGAHPEAVLAAEARYMALEDGANLLKMYHGR